MFKKLKAAFGAGPADPEPSPKTPKGNKNPKAKPQNEPAASPTPRSRSGSRFSVQPSGARPRYSGRNPPIIQKQGPGGYAKGRTLVGNGGDKVYRDYRAKLESAYSVVKQAIRDDGCPREKLAEWKFEGFLASGGFGSVYLVRHIKEGSTYALKIQSKKQFRDPRPGFGEYYLRQALREKRILYAMQNDFIVQLRSTCQDSENFYLIVDYGIYGELTAIIGLNTPEKTVKQIAAQILFAIWYIHRSGFAHRDLKPANVFIYADGYVKLGDFGLVKEVDINGLISGASGTPDYMAPEMFEGREYRKYVDLWAFGITVYEILYGDVPFENPRTRHWKALKTPTGKYKVDLAFPRSATELTKSFLRELLDGDVTRRLGCIGRGAEDVIFHKWFEEIDHPDILAKNTRFDINLLKTQVDTSPKYKFIPPKGDLKANWVQGF